MSVLCKAVAFLLLALPAVAQSQAFEVISIKPARSGDPRDMRMRVLPNGDLNASAASVLLLLRFAYDVPVNRSSRERKARPNTGNDSRLARRSFQTRDPGRAENDARLRSQRRKRRSESPEVSHRGEGLHV